MIKRTFLAVLVITLVVLLIPGLRQRVQPRIDEFRERLGQKLEGPLAPVLTPYRTLRTQTRMGEVTTLLIRDRNMGKNPPDPDDFDDYLVRFQLEAQDAWGAPFIMDQGEDSLSVISAGPDLEYRTEDDVVEQIRYARPQRRFFRPR